MATTEPGAERDHVHLIPASGSRLRCGAHTVGVSRPNSETMLISVVGELDLAVVDRLRDPLKHRIKSCLDTVILDLSAVSFCDSAGVDLLRECRNRAEAYETTFRVLAHTPGPVTRLLWLVDSSLLDAVVTPETYTNVE